MTSITFENVSVDFPIYNASGRSLKKHLMKIATGGHLNTNDRGAVVVRALDELNFTFKTGERIGLLGHNGAGKSTLLRVLSGAYEPSSGIANIQGEIGSLIDISLGIDPEATGRQNIFYRGRLLGMSHAEIVKNFDQIVDFTELGNFIDMPMRTFSSGMQLRLAFAISTTMRPDILLMDEWLSVGDEAFQQKAEERLNNLVDATDILVIASHSHELISKVCNRVLWMEHGKLRMDGSPEEVCKAYFDPNIKKQTRHSKGTQRFKRAQHLKRKKLFKRTQHNKRA